MESQRLQKQLLEEHRQFKQDLTGGLFNHFNHLLTDHERSRERKLFIIWPFLSMYLTMEKVYKQS